MRTTTLRYLLAAAIAAFAFSAVMASAAAAAAPEFTVVPDTFTVSATTSHFYAPGEIEFTCTANTASGEVTTATKATSKGVTFTGCKAKEKTKTACAANSAGAKNAEEIVTKELSAELGSVAKSEAPNTETGLDLKPTSGSEFTTLEAKCVSPEKEKVEGSVIAEVKPTKTKTTTGELILECLSAKSTNQKIFEIGGKSDTLTAFGAEACFEGTDTVTFAKEEEVT
ncbi:MAG TPA: hypothetical protein VMD79_11695 [Solirubrobacteraceae bacterium]|nr:hypothetical protein [Solirubrobacteraceae bacterium]